MAKILPYGVKLCPIINQSINQSIKLPQGPRLSDHETKFLLTICVSTIWLFFNPNYLISIDVCSETITWICMCQVLALEPLLRPWHNFYNICRIFLYYHYYIYIYWICLICGMEKRTQIVLGIMSFYHIYCMTAP